jgi:hypothetical protein
MVDLIARPLGLNNSTTLTRFVEYASHIAGKAYGKGVGEVTGPESA